MTNQQDRRNPYLVVGLPYGSSMKQVRKGFAKRTKDVTSGAITAFTMEDLTWALSQLECSLSDPEVDVTGYRAPANPALFGSENGRSQEVGFFCPAPELVARASGPVTPEHLEGLVDETVSDWLEGILKQGADSFQIPYPSLD